MDSNAPYHQVTTNEQVGGHHVHDPVDHTAVHTVDHHVNDQTEPVSSARRPSVQQAEAAMAEAQRRGSLGSTPNPTRKDFVTTENATTKEIPPSSSVGQQNAPGRAGSIGEAVLGGFGYGGATVERPKEEQGLGEKIVNFLGA